MSKISKCSQFQNFKECSAVQCRGQCSSGSAAAVQRQCSAVQCLGPNSPWAKFALAQLLTDLIKG